jgi:hypothetical protein
VQAYIDPGAGAMLWQILAAAALGALFFVRKLNLRRWFRKNPRD